MIDKIIKIIDDKYTGESFKRKSMYSLDVSDIRKSIQEKSSSRDNLYQTINQGLDKINDKSTELKLPYNYTS